MEPSNTVSDIGVTWLVTLGRGEEGRENRPWLLRTVIYKVVKGENGAGLFESLLNVQ